MSVGTIHTSGQHTTITIDADQLLDSTICSTNEEIARLNEQIDTLRARRNKLAVSHSNLLDVQMGHKPVENLTIEARKEIIYQTMHQAAQRAEGQTMVVDLGFEPTEDEKSYAMNVSHELEDPIYGNTFSIEKNLVAFSEYKN